MNYLLIVIKIVFKLPLLKSKKKETGFTEFLFSQYTKKIIFKVEF